MVSTASSSPTPARTLPTPTCCQEMSFAETRDSPQSTTWRQRLSAVSAAVVLDNSFVVVVVVVVAAAAAAAAVVVVDIFIVVIIVLVVASSVIGFC